MLNDPHGQIDALLRLHPAALSQPESYVVLRGGPCSLDTSREASAVPG
jgi:hypothetical protein